MNTSIFAYLESMDLVELSQRLTELTGPNSLSNQAIAVARLFADQPTVGVLAAVPLEQQRALDEIVRATRFYSSASLLSEDPGLRLVWRGRGLRDWGAN